LFKKPYLVFKVFKNLKILQTKKGLKKMLNEEQIKKAKRLLSLKKDESVKVLGARLRGWIKRIEETEKELNGNALIRGLNLILSDLQLKEVEEAKEAKKVNLENVKNEVLKKFGDKILELKEEGLSVRKIAEYINKKSKRKISYVTIYNFLKQQNKKDTNG
jgi:hypothetical protein